MFSPKSHIQCALSVFMISSEYGVSTLNSNIRSALSSYTSGTKDALSSYSMALKAAFSSTKSEFSIQKQSLEFALSLHAPFCSIYSTESAVSNHSVCMG